MPWCLTMAAKDYAVTDFGAVADGTTLNTRTIQHAIDYIHRQGGGRLVFAPGKYLTGTIYLKSNVTLHLEGGATLLGSTNPWDYDKNPIVNWMSMIFAVHQQHVGITDKASRRPTTWWTTSTGDSSKTRSSSDAPTRATVP